MNLHTKWVALVIGVAVINTMCQAQKNDSSFSPQLREMEVKLPHILDSAHIPGMSIAIIDKGEVIWNKGFGVVNIESRVKVVERTIFPGASLGKPVFAYAALKLADEGKLHLDSTVISCIPLKYLEENFLKGTLVDADIKLITPGMILCHSSGLPNWRNPSEAVKTFFKPDTKYSYW